MQKEVKIFEKMKLYKIEFVAHSNLTANKAMVVNQSRGYIIIELRYNLKSVGPKMKNPQKYGSQCLEAFVFIDT